MATNLGIDERLLAEAQRLGKQPTKKATVNDALTEYIKRRKRLKSLDLIGKIEFDPRYDYKKSRRRK
jgi:Arc/MetJ family transcription regulator